MTIAQLLPQQQAVAAEDLETPTFLTGPYGAGKTTTGVARLHHLLQTGTPPETILVLVPQRSLGQPYLDLQHTRRGLAPGQVKVQTLAGFARAMVDLFWPLIAGEAGFATPNQPPIFLTLETAQFFLDREVQPLMETEGYFSEVTLHPHRLYRQILDALNKAAVVGFPHTDLSARLNAAYEGDPALRGIYLQAQDCAVRFRTACLANNLLDFSLTLETFLQHIAPRPLFSGYRRRIVRHVIADNLEEDTPVAHDLLLEWLPDLASALLIADTEGGFRTFLGADPHSAQRFAKTCPKKVRLEQSLVNSPAMGALIAAFGRALDDSGPKMKGPMRPALVHHTVRFLPDLLEWTASEAARLIHEEGVPPGEIAILAPFLPDTLRFGLQQALDAREVPHRSRRPSRALREEPAARSLLTLAGLAHPGWSSSPTRFDVLTALSSAIPELDRMRAALLVQTAYQPGNSTLQPFESIPDETRSRIGYRLGARYDDLRTWLEDVRALPQEELDVFFSQLFGEVLSQPGFGFHASFDAARVTDHLIRSTRAFRRTTGDVLRAEGLDPGAEFVRLVADGLLGGPYGPRDRAQEEAVLLAPAFTFLMQNQPVAIQFWLSINSNAWWQRIYQPLTHPYVLSRQWRQGRVWTDHDEVFYSRQTLHHLTRGLLRRCRQRVYLGINEVGINGFEERGPLMGALQQVLLDINREESNA